MCATPAEPKTKAIFIKSSNTVSSLWSSHRTTQLWILCIYINYPQWLQWKPVSTHTLHQVLQEQWELRKATSSPHEVTQLSASSAFSPLRPTNMSPVLCLLWEHSAAEACPNMCFNIWSVMSEVAVSSADPQHNSGGSRFVWCQQGLEFASGCDGWWLQVWMRERKNIFATKRNKSHSLLFTLLFTNWLLSLNRSSCSIKQLYCCRMRHIRYGSCLNILGLQLKFMILFICTSCLPM